MVVQTKNSTSSSENAETTESSSESSKMEAAALLNSLRKRQKSSSPNGFDSLEILRRNVQYFFNVEIKNVMKDFVEKFFQPAIKNIKENTDENISENQIQEICKNLLENCAKMQFSNSTYQSDSSRNTTENETSDSDNSSSGQGQSLLHQALKRKRTDSENEKMILKRQFFITSKPSVFSSQNSSGKLFNKPSLLTSALTSPPKTMSSRPVFHLITTNRNSLKSSHAELVSLLKSSNNSTVTSHVKIEEGSEIKIKKEKEEF